MAFVGRFIVVLLGLIFCVASSKPPLSVASKISLEVVPNPIVLKLLGRSQIDFVADLLWVRMANMAGRANSPAEFATLLPIGNLIADLAPRFRYPYFVGGVLAPVPKGRRGEYENVEGALKLLDRGVNAVPDYTRLYVQKAYTELEMMHDPVAAGRTLGRASAIPGAPSFLSGLAARLLTEGGSYDDAREFARSMAASDDPQVRKDFELRLKQIDLEEVLAAVDDAARRYAAQEGHITTSVEELIAKGYLTSKPVDPFGGNIELTVNGARSSVETRRLRIHVPNGD